MLRATLKSLLSRKLRLFLSGIAVVLGVMFVSGSFVLTDTLGRSFDNLFTGIYQYTDIEVSKTSDVPSLTGQPTLLPMPATDVTTVEGIPGVTNAVGQVFVDGAGVVGKNGKVVLGSNAPRFGANWVGPSELIEIRPGGRAPAADNEIMLSANTVKTTGYKVGDQVGIVTAKQPKKAMFTLVGVVGYSGGRDSLGGESSVFFTEPVAQRLMLGETGVYSLIDVKVDDSANSTEVRDRIAAKMGAGYDVKTGDELAKDSAAGPKEFLKYFNYLLLGFAGIALFVGTFLILNTFSILVAQRTRELALFRAMGAARGQVIGSVLIEAVVIGLVASVVGLLLGIGIGALLGAVIGGLLSGGALQVAALAVPWSAVIAAFAVGLGITVIAALLPAARASRIAPVAAMRESATLDRPLTALTISGAAVLAIGATLLGLGLAGELGDASLWGVLGGVLICFVGIALLTPLVSKPVVALLGRAVGRNAAAKLGRRNSARNPRRTAITAAALMVSIAIVTGISVVFASISASTVEVVDTGIEAQIAISADPLTGGLGAVDPSTLDRIRALPDVDSVVGVYGDLVKVNGTDDFVSGFDDPAAAVAMFKIEPTAGSLTPLSSGTIIVDDRTASDRRLTPGSTVTALMANSGEKTYRVVGVYKRTAVMSGIAFAPDDITAGFSRPAPMQGYVTVRSGANVDAVLAQVDDVLKDSPEVSAANMDDFIAQQTQVFNFVLIFVQLLLILAMVIAVLGIINTLALSMTERTRELGLIRAVGMKRGQVMWMVTVESVVISVFGALLGVVVGAGLGVAVFQALKEEGLTKLAFPWVLMVIYVIASVGVGLIAGLLPAIRAARLDVLKAIAYE